MFFEIWNRKNIISLYQSNYMDYMEYKHERAFAKMDYMEQKWGDMEYAKS